MRFVRLVFAVPFLLVGVILLLIGTAIMGLKYADEFTQALRKLGIK